MTFRKVKKEDIIFHIITLIVSFFLIFVFFNIELKYKEYYINFIILYQFVFFIYLTIIYG